MKTPLVLVISGLFSVSLATGQCPNSTWVRRGNKCYFWKRVSGDLYENIALCNQLNASMVSIPSDEENIQLTELLPSGGYFWLGLGRRSKDSKEFHWFDGSPFLYESWMEEPNVTYKYFGAYFREGDWFTDTALSLNSQVCSLDLTLKASPKKTPIPAEFREVPGQCPNTTWQKLGNKCIFFDTRKEMTYMENQALCKKLNATMVSIHSEAENIQLSRVFRYRVFWIGFKQISRKDRLYEWEDGSSKTYENWWEGDPSYLGKKYWAAYFHSGHWYDTYSFYKKTACCQTSLFNHVEQFPTETTTNTATQLNLPAKRLNAMLKDSESPPELVRTTVMEQLATTSTYD